MTITKIIRFHGENLTPAVLNSPPIVCLCGSTRFKDKFLETAAVQTLMGKIVLMPGVFGHADSLSFINKATKTNLDELHKRKIDMADEVYIINVKGYIGSSTASEIAYAGSIGKKIVYMEPP